MVEETYLSETFFVGMVSCDSAQKQQDDTGESKKCSGKGDTWLVSLQINGAIVALRTYTGVQANLISMKSPKKKKKGQLKDYNGKDIENIGQCRLKVRVKNKT